MSTNLQEGDNNLNAQIKATDLDPAEYLHTSPRRLRVVMAGIGIMLLVSISGLAVGFPHSASLAGKHWDSPELRLQFLALSLGVFTLSSAILGFTIHLMVRFCKIVLHRDLLHGLQEPKKAPVESE